ncbi:MAG: hypothetical protein GC162_16850 [Planctomycetes bacterium]|nr:hypothetical protein [Planctomycetota bacterium]
MPNFSTDGDLLAYEPNVFAELPFASQRLLKVTDASVSGSIVTSETGGFASLGAGNVVMLEGNAYAVAVVTDDHTLELTAAPVGLSATEDLTLIVPTMRPQAAVVHDELLRAVNIHMDDPAEELDEDAIVSVTLMKRLEAIGTLSRAYAGAIALVGDNKEINAKAERYRLRFTRALASAQVLIDTDGDGEADVWRSPGVARLVRD